MANFPQVHWYQGLFLQPHHLQAMQRHLLGRMGEERALAFSYPYGLTASLLSRDALENRRIRFDKLRLVMPSGLEIDVPGNTDLPPLDIAKAFDSATGSLTVSIGVPTWYATRPNTIDLGGSDDARLKLLYRVNELDISDENSGTDPQPLQVRRINARLMLPNDDRTDMEVLPLLRVTSPAAADLGLPRADTSFFPPCLVMEGWMPLRDLVRELVEQIEATRGKVVKEISRDGFDVEAMRPVQLKQLFRLRTLNRFSARLPSLMRAPGIPPFMIYLELRELLGELAASQPDNDVFAIGDYDHDNPAVVFKELVARIRSFLGEEVKGRFWKLDLTREPGCFGGVVEEQYRNLPEYFLAIKSQEDPTQLSTLVHNADRFKLMPRKMIRIAVRGVKLQFDHHPPSALPSAVGLSYFRLIRSDLQSQEMWKRISTDGQLAVTWPGVDVSDAQLSLYGMISE